MVLNSIKTETTWNDAASAINSNFRKVRQAIAEQGEPLGGTPLSRLTDVQIEDIEKGQALVYNGEKWINEIIQGAGGAEGSATLTQDIVAETKVGYIEQGEKLKVGSTLTQVLIQMLTGEVVETPPSVTIGNIPKDVEVGSTITISPTYTFNDGKFSNTYDETVPAKCTIESVNFTLNENAITSGDSWEAQNIGTQTLKVSVKHSAPTAVVKKKNGEDYTPKMGAGEKHAQGTFDVCYRWFFGFMTKAQTEGINSSSIRGLRYNNLITPSSFEVTLVGETEVEAGKDMIIAIPKGYVLSEIIEFSQGLNYVHKFTLSTMKVQDVSNEEHDYNVYIYPKSPSASASKIKTIKIKKE